MREDWFHINAECAGKTPYPTKAKALDRIQCQVRDRRRRKQKRQHTVLSTYKCPHCFAWHVGSTDRTLRKEKVDTHQNRRQS